MIFKTMMSHEEYKIGLATHLLTEEANHWLIKVKKFRKPYGCS